MLTWRSCVCVSVCVGLQNLRTVLAELIDEEAGAKTAGESAMDGGMDGPGSQDKHGTIDLLETPKDCRLMPLSAVSLCGCHRGAGHQGGG